jgi:hypothetical protein
VARTGLALVVLLLQVVEDEGWRRLVLVEERACLLRRFPVPSRLDVVEDRLEVRPRGPR